MLAAGKDGALLRFSLGNEYLKAGAAARAAEHLQRAVALDAGYTAAWKLLGKALAAAGRADGIHYVAMPSGKPPADFRLATATTDDNGTLFTFVNVVDEFPQQLAYHRGGEGWLYASIEGKIKGEARKATFPYRRVDCETGETIPK